MNPTPGMGHWRTRSDKNDKLIADEAMDALVKWIFVNAPCTLEIPGLMLGPWFIVEDAIRDGWKQGGAGTIAVELLGELIMIEQQMLERLELIEAALTALVQQRAVKDWYTTDEVASLLGRAKFTVREWARLGRIHAEKRRSGRGRYFAWVISHQELLRFQREGLLPLR